VAVVRGTPAAEVLALAVVPVQARVAALVRVPALVVVLARARVPTRVEVLATARRSEAQVLVSVLIEVLAPVPIET
jgi:hypothetical protein